MQTAPLTPEQQALTDAEIVARIARGDEQAFTLLIAAR